MRLSLVIPAYNEAGRIGHTVTQVCGYLDQQRYDWEIIVVIDGGPKAAADEARTAAGARSNVRVIENDANRGKGYSVRRGFAQARGDRRVFIDADLSLPIDGLDGMMQRFDAGADVVIASRTAPGSRVEGAPPAMRDLMSRAFNFAVQSMVLPGLGDTQCGFKGFTAAAATAIFDVAQSDRFGFDGFREGQRAVIDVEDQQFDFRQRRRLARRQPRGGSHGGGAFRAQTTPARIKSCTLSAPTSSPVPGPSQFSSLSSAGLSSEYSA